MITASALTRLKNCPSSAVLPRAENHNIWSGAGHEDHERLAQWVNDRDDSAISDIVEAGLLAKLPALIPVGARPEIALGYDVALGTGRIIGENLGRAYGEPGPFEIVGSCDVFALDGDTVVIVDWKTGFADVEPTATNAQLWFYGLAAARATGRHRVILLVIYTKTGRVDECGADALDLADFAGQLERLHHTVAARQASKNRAEILETREGSWCKHCASKHVCPSKTALLVQVATSGLAVIGDTEMTPERAAGAYEQISRIEQLVKDARARLVTYVDEQGPIDLGNGRMFGRYHRSGNKKLDGAVAARAIAEVVGESAKEFAAMAIEMSTSQAAIDRAAKQFAEKRGAAKLKKAVIDRIEALGGVSQAGDSFPIGEFAKGQEAEKPAIDVGEVNKLLAGVG